MFGLHLPNNWVYVVYENGKPENVANQDTLTEAEAKRFAETWSKARNTKVIMVNLVNSKGTVLKGYQQ